MLVPLRCSHLLHHLDGFWKHFCLRAGAGFLDQGTRTLHRPIRHVVHKRRHKHRDRLRHYPPSNACYPASAARETTEISLDRYLCCRWLVSNCHTLVGRVAGPRRFTVCTCSFSYNSERVRAALYYLPLARHCLTTFQLRQLMLYSVCIVSILRLQSLVAISNSTDQSYDNPPAATWSSVEANVGIICSCLPLLRPLMTKCLPGVFSSYRRDTRSTPRIYPTIGSARSRPLPSHNGEYPLETTTKGSGGGSRGSSDAEGRDIQVETHIHVKVEGGSDRLSGWATPKSKQTFSDDRATSTDTLVQDVKDVV